MGLESYPDTVFRARRQSLPMLRAVCLGMLMSMHCISLFGLDPSKHISQYTHKAWRVEDGTLPMIPSWISQTSDGYLFVGGVSQRTLRFDGVRFVPWDPPFGSSREIHRLLPAKSGGLWISDERGIAHVKGNRVLAHFDLPGSVYSGLAEDSDGSLWVVMSYSQRSGKPLCHITGEIARCFGEAEGATFTRADSVVSDGKGGAWIGTDTALVHWSAGHSEKQEFKGLRSNIGQGGFGSLVLNSDGSLWVGIMKSGPGLGLERFVDGISKPFVSGSFDGSKLIVNSLLKDRDQNLWVTTENNGLYRIHGDSVDHFGRADGLSSDSVSQVYEDREGIIWAATTGGLDSFADRNVTTFSRSEGLQLDDVASVTASRDGTVWIANADSLESIRDGVVSSIRSKDGLPGQQVTSMLEDRAGQLWVGVDDSLYLYVNHHFRRLPEPNHRPLGMVVGIAEDVEGNIWAECASNPRKLVRIKNFQIQEEFSSSQVPAGHALAADPKGGIWVSTVGGDLVRVQNGAVQILPLKLKGDTARQIEAEPDGSVLVAAPIDGLVRMNLGKTQSLSKANGLPCDGVFAFIRDDQKDWWLEAPCGYISVADSEIQRWWVHPNTTVKCQFFDVLDGARTNRADFSPTAKSPDGRLWFATGIDVQTIDPRHLVFNKLPPPVHIEQITADHRTYEVDSEVKDKLTLPAQSRQLEIDYTALSMITPEKVHFRYKLDGVDRDWRDVENRRQAFYTDPGPGTYHFHVIACNNSGVWNETGASVNFSVAPAWFQTIWFEILCALLVCAILWMAYSLRVRQLTVQVQQRLGARMDERERIARELHDTLLQGFQGLMLRFQAVMDRIPKNEPAREEMEKALERADDVLLEGRNRVSKLRAESTVKENLALAINSCGEELSRNHTTEFSMAVVGTPQPLDPVVLDEVYRIAREALLNAFTHSHAQKIEAELTFDLDKVRLSIRDNGDGIDPEVVKSGRKGHWGLYGMRERAQSIGGHLNIWSNSGAGAEVELIIPAEVAFQRSARRMRWKWFKRVVSGGW